MYSKEYLMVFHYKQKGWSGTEILRYNDKQEAKNDLLAVTNYMMDSENVDSERAWETVKNLHRTVDHSDNEPVRFSVDGKRESFQVELVPYNNVADWMEIKNVYIIHKNGRGNDFENEYLYDASQAKNRFRKMIEGYINAQEDSYKAKVQRISLDEYMKEGNYRWCIVENDDVKSIKMNSYKVKDFRFDKSKYLEGQDKSLVLGIIEAYRNKERFFMTPTEKRWATEEERRIVNLTPEFTTSPKSREK